MERNFKNGTTLFCISYYSATGESANIDFFFSRNLTSLFDHFWHKLSLQGCGYFFSYFFFLTQLNSGFIELFENLSMNSAFSELRMIDPLMWYQNTVVVLTKFIIVPFLQACRKNSWNERSTLFFYDTLTLPWFDEFFLIICEFQTIVKFVKSTTVIEWEAKHQLSRED